METIPEKKVKLYGGLRIALIVFLAVVAANVLFDGGLRNENRNVNTISFTGHGEVTAVPDIANISFTISKDAKTVKDAQAAVAVVEQKALDLLESSGIEAKDIKTNNASFYPKYEYKYDAPSILPCTQYGCPPNPGKSVIVGYTASESITLKVRNTDDAGKIIQGLGTVGVSDLSGPAFAVDKEDDLKIEARRKAIEDAQAKAKILAKDLGVRLGKVSSFSENGNYPIMYAAKGMMADSYSNAPTPAQLPKGENTINSDVTITYEIR